jgi:putative MATE family efflux protein
MTTQAWLESVIHSKTDVGLREQLKLVFFLSLPAILSQLSTIVMEYIDASMVGSLGAEASASIGLVATTTWMFGGICTAVASGFSVQVAHLYGAKKKKEAENVLRQAFVACAFFGLLALTVGCGISRNLPQWLGGNKDIVDDAYLYFLVFAFSLPIYILYHLLSSMLRCSGNMKVPSVMSITICAMDVVFNFFFIFPTHEIPFLGMDVACPGLGLGVLGAALGTLSAWCVGFVSLLIYISSSRSQLRLNLHGGLMPENRVIKKAVMIGLPIGMERIISCGAQITSTIIVAPLGTVAIASNAFGITIESLCYMPGYGVADAATTLIGQSMGADRKDLIRRFSYITLGMGVCIMTAFAAIMYAFAPDLMTLMSPDESVQHLTASVLRLEAFAEPLFATSIVCYGIFVGTGNTIIPSIINFSSIWVVRIPLAAFLAGTYGLMGVWIAMATELCVRGLVLLARLVTKLRKL